MPFPSLALPNWPPTRATLQNYARIVSRVRRELSPPLKHWWHISLQTTAVGLTTTPIYGNGQAFDIEFNFFTHEVGLRTSGGDLDVITLEGQSAREFGEELLEILNTFGINVALPAELITIDAEGVYDDAAVEAFWQALYQLDRLMKQFKAELPLETSPVQLWPHNFDLAMTWLSGRQVPDQDPQDPEKSDEQMSFGFAPGDAYIPHPYLYATAYPLPDGLVGSPLPPGATWHTRGFTGAILLYEALTSADNPDELVLNFWRTAQNGGAAYMGDKTR